MTEFLNAFKETFLALFSDIKITYIIDIGIITFLFYSLIKLVKETRAIKIMNGLLILFVIYKISEWSHLYALNYLLRNTLTIGLIAIVIIFQPELRKMLERMGNANWLIKRTKAAVIHSEQNVDAIVEAAMVMSRKKIGALIVIVGKQSLSDIAETGTELDAAISAELIMNVFFPKSPLHDGAMLIKDDRIIAAGCLLPLSENMDVSKELGTRHRAGLGISETSDARIIIVSEETGVISIAHEGELRRYIDTSGLREAISDDYLLEEKEKEAVAAAEKAKAEEAQKADGKAGSADVSDVSDAAKAEDSNDGASAKGNADGSPGKKAEKQSAIGSEKKPENKPEKRAEKSAEAAEAEGGVSKATEGDIGAYIERADEKKKGRAS